MSSYLGQNFLKDHKYIEFIISKIKAYKPEVILEIGPGKGALTKKLVNLGSEIYVFERDSSFIDILSSILPSSNIFWGDFLDQDLQSIYSELGLSGRKVLVCGNLPYYITSPIFRKLFVDFDKFDYGIFMIQKEVGEKIKSDSKSKSYLRWLVNHGYDVRYLKNVPAKAFSPAPKVDSCIVDFNIKADKIDIDLHRLIELLNNISMYKRKSLGKIWKMLQKKDNLNIDINKDIPETIASKRLEEITWEEMKTLI